MRNIGNISQVSFSIILASINKASKYEFDRCKTNSQLELINIFLAQGEFQKPNLCPTMNNKDSGICVCSCPENVLDIENVIFI